MASRLAIIGGTGLTALDGLNIERRQVAPTPFGEPSAPLSFGTLAGVPVVFLARHGDRHVYPPHRINYRANLWALKHSGAERVIAVAAVGGIRADLTPATLAVPDQIIDYTWGRPSTFFEDNLDQVTHIDFTRPYCADLRGLLLQAGRAAGLEVVAGGVYGVTQGPRLETVAEIARMERDGCAMVGMTGMPEAALARELDLRYAACAVIANWAAGKTEGEITLADITRHLDVGMARVGRLLQALVTRV